MKINLNNIEVHPWSPWYSLLWREANREGSDVTLESVHNDNRHEIIEVNYEQLPIIAQKTTNVYKRDWYDGELHNNKNGFIVVGDAKKYGNEIGKILKSYFSVCMKEDEKDGLLIGDNVNIFSAAELPFETFNNVYFQGLQPTPKMHRMIKDSKVLISPNPNLPRVAIDASFLGTPILIRESEINKSVFGKCSDRCLYIDEDDLSEKLKWFSEIDINSNEYKNLVEFCYECVDPLFNPKNTLMVIKHWVEKNECEGRIE